MSVATRRLVRGLPWLLAAVVAVAGTMLALLPASWVASRFAAATGQRILLLNPEGSLWHGRATLALAGGANATGPIALPGRVAWRTAFWPLVVGRVHMTMRDPEALVGAVVIDATRHDAMVSPGALAVPASLLTGLGAPFNTLDLEGDVRLAWSDLRLLGDEGFGRVTLTLHDMASRVSRVRPLGTYRVVIDANGRDAVLNLATVKGPLLLDGRGTFSARGSVAFSGTAGASREQRDNLVGLLSLLGRPLGDGRYALIYNHS